MDQRSCCLCKQIGAMFLKLSMQAVNLGLLSLVVSEFFVERHKHPPDTGLHRLRELGEENIRSKLHRGAVHIALGNGTLSGPRCDIAAGYLSKLCIF